MIWYFILYIELFIRLCHKYYIILYFKLSIVLYIKFEIILQYILNYTVSYIIFYHIIFIFFFDPTKEYITYLTQDWHLARVVVCFPLTFWQSSYFSAMLSSETRSFLPPQPQLLGGAKGLCKALVLLLLFNFSVVLQTTVTRLWTIKHLHILHADCPITTHDSFLSSFFYLEYGTLWLLRAFKHTLLQSHSHPRYRPNIVTILASRFQSHQHCATSVFQGVLASPTGSCFWDAGTSCAAGFLWALTATKDTRTSATHGKSLTNHNSSCKQVDWW